MDTLDFLGNMTSEELRGFTDGIWQSKESSDLVYTEVHEPMI
jgi:hypothetical protein